MRDLIDDRGAVFNESRTHRRKLWRAWDKTKPVLICVGMNPSKADEHDNDPTVERVCRRAMQMGYGGVTMLNVQDVIETDSRKLDHMPESARCTPDNISNLIEALDDAQIGRADILCAWGKPGQKYGPVVWFSEQAYLRNITLFCLKKNKDGSPAHPLYQPYSKCFEWFGGVSERDAAAPLASPDSLRV